MTERVTLRRPERKPVEDPEFTVLLIGAAYSGPAALKAIQAVTNLSLWHCRQLLDDAPATVQATIPYEKAIAALKHLRQAGVQAVIRCDYCERTLPTDGTPVDPAPCRSRYWPTAHCQANSETTCDLDRCPTHDPNWQRP
ncbi:ribosomal protein L7/L12 [Kitasatospora sp. NBC_00374]|uniref:ribosomal protein L7/L12 n=1 Tax=Kitasatospora sp. NBC_00374 TaxID=2975964 RepID=UPI00324E290A